MVRVIHGERLLTLHGPGGAGKTRLALELAGRAAPTAPVFADPRSTGAGSAHPPAGGRYPYLFLDAKVD